MIVIGAERQTQAAAGPVQRKAQAERLYAQLSARFTGDEKDVTCLLSLPSCCMHGPSSAPCCKSDAVTLAEQQDNSPASTPRSVRLATPRMLADDPSSASFLARVQKVETSDAPLLRAKLDSHAVLARRALCFAKTVKSLQHTMEAASCEGEIEHAIALLLRLLEIEKEKESSSSVERSQGHSERPLSGQSARIDGCTLSCQNEVSLENLEKNTTETEREVVLLKSKCSGLEQELRTCHREHERLLQMITTRTKESESAGQGFAPDTLLEKETTNTNHLKAEENSTPMLAPAFAKSSHLAEMIATHSRLTVLARQSGYEAPLDMKVVQYSTRSNVPKFKLNQFQPDSAKVEKSIDSLIAPPIFASPSKSIVDEHLQLGGRKPFILEGESYEGGGFRKPEGAAEDADSAAVGGGGPRGNFAIRGHVDAAQAAAAASAAVDQAHCKHGARTDANRRPETGGSEVGQTILEAVEPRETACELIETKWFVGKTSPSAKSTQVSCMHSRNAPVAHACSRAKMTHPLGAKMCKRLTITHVTPPPICSNLLAS